VEADLAAMVGLSTSGVPVSTPVGVLTILDRPVETTSLAADSGPSSRRLGVPRSGHLAEPPSLQPGPASQLSGVDQVLPVDVPVIILGVQVRSISDVR
jgi:hypothetical protein